MMLILLFVVGRVMASLTFIPLTFDLSPGLYYIVTFGPSSLLKIDDYKH